VRVVEPRAIGWLALIAICVVGAGCRRNEPTSAAAAPPTSASSSVAPPTTVARTTTSSTSTSTSTSSTSTSTSTSTTSTTSTSTSTTSTTVPSAIVATPALDAAFASLRDGNAAVSLTVMRDGQAITRLASGITNDGGAMTPDSPMVIASVSKLVTATSIARLVASGALAVDQPVPWADMGFATGAGWDTVTIRDLLDHTSGMPITRRSWLDDPGSCATPLAAVVAGSPGGSRGRWQYSNGNYCALGLVIEYVTGERLDAAAYRLVLDPAAIEGAHLTIDGALPGDAPYAKGVARFDRLGGAGQWVMSTDDVATMLATLTEADRAVLTYPGVLVDQYGWGHTGTVDGAVACAWLIEDGRTVIAVTVAGGRPGSGGGVCNMVVPAAAADVGLPYLGVPKRLPD
jgi:D-alanyl-D-alanine carboxypeptidase